MQCVGFAQTVYGGVAPKLYTRNLFGHPIYDGPLDSGDPPKFGHVPGKP